MSTDPLTGYLRAKVICVFRNGGRILVIQAYDPTKREHFYCPPGGRIEFGERSDVALRREIQEELGIEIENPELLGVIENIFTFDGAPGHEHVFVYDAESTDPSIYAIDEVHGRESNGEPFIAVWLDLSAIGPDTAPLYPEGLAELLRSNA